MEGTDVYDLDCGGGFTVSPQIVEVVSLTSKFIKLYVLNTTTYMSILQLVFFFKEYWEVHKSCKRNREASLVDSNQNPAADLVGRRHCCVPYRGRHCCCQGPQALNVLLEIKCSLTATTSH